MQYIHLGRDELSNLFFNPVKNNNCWIKPFGGLWCSEYNENTISSWYEWCKRESFKECTLDFGVVFDIKENAKIFVIDKYTDLLRLLEEYELKSISYSICSIDFEKLSKDYDAIKLTENGEHETRFSTPSLYGWDIESMLIMNFDIIKNQKRFKNNKKSIDSTFMLW